MGAFLVLMWCFSGAFPPLCGAFFELYGTFPDFYGIYVAHLTRLPNNGRKRETQNIACLQPIMSSSGIIIQYVKELIISYLQLFFFLGLFTCCLFSAAFMRSLRIVSPIIF